MELISVIIPVYNVHSFLKKCMDSIINQTYKNIEIIAVNDGSTDDSPEILKEYEHKDARVKIVNKKNGGLMSAWTEGLKHASADWITFVDSDDWIATDAIEIMMENNKEQPADVVIADYQEEWEDGRQNIIRNRMKPGFYPMEGSKGEETFARLINYEGGFRDRGVVINRWGKLIRKQLLLDNLIYCDTKISYGEDVNIMIPVFGSAASVRVLDGAVLYHYRMNQSSITHSYIKNMKMQVDILYQNLFQYVEDAQYGSKVIEALRLDYLSLIICCMRNEAKTKKYYKGAKKILATDVDEKWMKVCKQAQIGSFSKINQRFVRSVLHHSALELAVLLFVVHLKGNY